MLVECRLYLCEFRTACLSHSRVGELFLVQLNLESLILRICIGEIKTYRSSKTVLEK